MLHGATPGESTQPTFVLRFGDIFLRRNMVARIVKTALAPYEQGADIQSGVGIWQGEVEESVTVTMQASPELVEVVLAAMAKSHPDMRYVHVEVHRPQVEYVDLNAYRVPVYS